MDFYQDPPELENTYSNDSRLKERLSRSLNGADLKEVSSHLQKVGEHAVTDWLRWSELAEKNPPTLIQYDPWGKRIDRIEISNAWNSLEAAAAENGIVAAGYERKYGENSRVYQAALLYLFHPSSAFTSCPLAMTDGAARALELYGDSTVETKAFGKLTSKNPRDFWTSGQWMTERTGGSDVSGTSTTAKKSGTGLGWKLDGVKWFTSATTSQMAMLLARPEGAEEGSRGLSLFYTELRNEAGHLNDIEILRLKDKLGTKALPTAELRLKETPAKLVGDLGGGVKKISALFNITRVYNSVCATGHMRRALDLAQSFSRKRQAFGKLLIDHPLHAETMRELEWEFAKCFEFTFYVAHLLGKYECGTASDEDRLLLRALTPILKLHTARACMKVVSEVVEVFGGAGYVEDTGIPKLLRDAQVFSIWEGTTNVLSLDFLRALQRENVGEALLAKIERDFKSTIAQNKKAEWEFLTTALKAISKDPVLAEKSARKLSLAIGEIFGSALASV
jgi:putative acyl-CoA dehydrogenase